MHLLEMSVPWKEMYQLTEDRIGEALPDTPGVADTLDRGASGGAQRACSGTY